ncbi:hypothetical protein [Oricola thermophila]|uniref:Uncharacterized protein n=1 Tax=Oricola thermophila TaxID=2742145 RepID=A0A6N1V8D0_9HYPH|nr:hypothetical protein [Oricola thermophila]QKV17221.1 hypothetical protein HTY61_01435 [Oricola thermophila]
MSKYPTTENTDTQSGRKGPAVLIGAIVAATGLVGFSAWFANAENLFWSLLQAGLAWCL